MVIYGFGKGCCVIVFNLKFACCVPVSCRNGRTAQDSRVRSCE